MIKKYSLHHVICLVYYNNQLMDCDLQCPLCFNEYSSDNMPRLLTCGHTYCHSCLDTMIIEEDNQFRLKCTEDNNVFYLKTNQITQFPKNIALFKLIENKKNSSGSSFKEDSSLEITKIQKHQDSRGNESEQQIINQIASSEKLSNNQKKNSKREKIDLKDTSKQYQKNEIKEIKKVAAKVEQELCLVHQKPLQIVCVVDMQKICSKCAIFGQHKGHEFKSIDQIQQQGNVLHEDILNIYNNQQDIMKQWKSINSKEILQILYVNKQKIVKEVSDRYKKLRETIMKSEQAMLKKINQTCHILEKKIDSTLKIDENVLKQYDKFQKESFAIIIKFQQSAYEQKLRMLYDSSTTKILYKGKDIISRLKSQHNNVFNQIQKIINSIRLEHNDEVYYTLDKFSQIKIQQEPLGVKEHKEVKIVHGQDQSLLQSSQQEDLENNTVLLSSVFTNQQSLPPQEPKYFAKMENSKSQLIPKSRDSSAIFVDEPQHQKIQRPSKKKLKSIKVPQKIQKILQALYNDTLDTLDLTNAELGDGIILQICQFLRGSRVKTVKFIRNKLSDDAVAKMIIAFGGVITLNLSQNFLTQQSLVHLANARNAMPSLKTVILSQNRIIQRKHKEFIQRLKKLDLNVST